MHAQYLWGHYLMPLVLLIFLFLLQNWCSAGRQMSLSAHPAGFNTSHPFLVQPEQSSHNQLVLFWSTPTSLVEPFSLPLSHIFRGSVVYVSLPISPDEKHQLAQWGFTQCHAACSFLPPPGRSRPQVRVASIFQPSPSHRGCPGQPWGVPVRQPARNLGEWGWLWHFCSFQLSFQTAAVERVRGIFFPPLWFISWVNNFGFSTGALRRKEPAFQRASLLFLSEAKEDNPRNF